MLFPLQGQELSAAPARPSVNREAVPPSAWAGRGWYAAAAVWLGVAYWILARSCQYDHGAVLRYASYVAGFVWLPGHLLLMRFQGRAVGLVESFALGVPVGFAFETALYLASSAAGLREAYGWFGAAAVSTLAVTLLWERGARRCLPVRPEFHPGVIAGLAAAVLVVMVTAASRMYAPAPLSDGHLLHSTHPDWVYLLSQAAEIKWRWPLEDPSLSGTPLSYHYFLLVHAASSSHVTGVELPVLLFRLSGVSVGLALLAQAYVLGRRLGQTPWAGVLAVWLLLATGELSWRESTSGGWFGSLFLEWLYVSPTFALGMVYMGALLLWMHDLAMAARMSVAHYTLLFVLAMGATGAKGTAVIPLGVAITLVGLGRLGRTRQWPARHVAMGATLVAGFGVCYVLVLRSWQGAGTAFAPLALSRITAFWQHAADWRHALANAGLSGPFGKALAEGGLALAIFAGSSGILLLGLVYAARSRGPLARWLGAAAVAHLLLGQLLILESHGESYLYLPARLPLAALTGAAIVALWRRWMPAVHAWELRAIVAGTASLVLVLLLGEGMLTGISATLLGGGLLYLLGPAHRWRARDRWRVGPTLVMAGFGVLVAVQFNYFCLSTRSGLRLWLSQGAATGNASLATLDEALGWIRARTPVDAVIVADLFTPEAATGERPAVLEETTADKYYYYGAISERRLWVQGPCYLRDEAEAGRRMAAIAELKRGRWPEVLSSLDRPCYLLVDFQAPRPFTRVPAGAVPVFSNQRAQVYRLSPPDSERFREGPLRQAEKNHADEKYGTTRDPGVGEPGEI